MQWFCMGILRAGYSLPSIFHIMNSLYWLCHHFCIFSHNLMIKGLFLMVVQSLFYTVYFHTYYKGYIGVLFPQLCMLLPELENPVLRNSLEYLNIHGWHFDKQSQSHDGYLNEDDLIPLLTYASQDSLPYFNSINEYLLRLVETAPILELIEVAPLSEMHQRRSIVDGEDSFLAKLIKQTEFESSPQVSFVTFHM